MDGGSATSCLGSLPPPIGTDAGALLFPGLPPPPPWPPLPLPLPEQLPSDSIAPSTHDRTHPGSFLLYSRCLSNTRSVTADAEFRLDWRLALLPPLPTRRDGVEETIRRTMWYTFGSTPGGAVGPPLVVAEEDRAADASWSAPIEEGGPPSSPGAGGRGEPERDGGAEDGPAAVDPDL